MLDTNFNFFIWVQMFCFDLVLHPINAELEKKISPKSFSFERDESYLIQFSFQLIIKIIYFKCLKLHMVPFWVGNFINKKIGGILYNIYYLLLLNNNGQISAIFFGKNWCTKWQNTTKHKKNRLEFERETNGIWPFPIKTKPSLLWIRSWKK